MAFSSSQMSQGDDVRRLVGEREAQVSAGYRSVSKDRVILREVAGPTCCGVPPGRGGSCDFAQDDIPVRGMTRERVE